MERLLDLDDPPTAVFALSDEMAFGAYGALQERGLSWPDDIAVIGIDDHELASMVGLSTIRLAPRELGAAAAERLLQLIDDEGAFEPSEEEARADLAASADQIELVVRASTVAS